MGAELDAGRAPEPEVDPDRDRIVAEEEKVLDRVRRTLIARRRERIVPRTDYDEEMIALRDQIHEARIEDVPPLIEEMERLQQVAARRALVQDEHVDPESPYFGRMVLEEGDRRREVLIGRKTFLDPRTGIRIVDWRDAPVSRIYYRYQEGDDYDETFGGRDVHGAIVTRRTLAVVQGALRRVGAPQGTFVRGTDQRWRRVDTNASRLTGGQGVALRAEHHLRPGKLGVLEGVDGRVDKHLPEIAALIDSRQYDLITMPSSGLVVVQGGAGSGKTTIGLHRLAFLAFADPKTFRPERMLVVVFNDALARYISRVLPALGIPGVLAITYERWAHKLRTYHVPGLPRGYSESTPADAVRVKKHPAMLLLIDAHVSEVEARVSASVQGAAQGEAAVLAEWMRSKGRPVMQRVRKLSAWLVEPKSSAAAIPVAVRHPLEQALSDAEERTRDVAATWAELLTDKSRLTRAFAQHASGPVDARAVDRTVSWCTRVCMRALAARDEPPEREHVHEDETKKDEDAPFEDRAAARVLGIDGIAEEEAPTIDREDDTLLLRLHQRLHGRLGRSKGEALSYEHVFIDEAQDMSPVELAVVVDTTTPRKSLTLAGDTAQRLLLDNGFTDWPQLLRDLGMPHVGVDSLQRVHTTYRSTHEIMEFSEAVLGPLAHDERGTAVRHGTPVELFRFADSGEAVAFLGEALRELMQNEPRASVLVVARYPEQADMYYRGLVTAEVPHLRRIAEQDFPFKAGVDVTDVRQVKGLEFDYVVLVEASGVIYPEDEESRHLLHIAATRAAHQLWVTTTQVPSPLLPSDLRDRSY